MLTCAARITQRIRSPVVKVIEERERLDCTARLCRYDEQRAGGFKLFSKGQHGVGIRAVQHCQVQISLGDAKCLAKYLRS